MSQGFTVFSFVRERKLRARNQCGLKTRGISFKFHFDSIKAARAAETIAEATVFAQLKCGSQYFIQINDENAKNVNLPRTKTK
jgi:hypothetical protein